MEPTKEQLQAREMFLNYKPFNIWINSHNYGGYTVTIYMYNPDNPDKQFINYFENTLEEAEFRANNLSKIFGLEIINWIKK